MLDEISGIKKSSKDTATTKNYNFNITSYSFEDNDNQYDIIDSPIPLNNKHESMLTRLISKTLDRYILGFNNILVVGLGNRHLSSDSLGANAIRFIVPSKNEVRVSAITTSVNALTGIGAYEIIKSLVELNKYDCVVLIDSLSSSIPQRLCKSYQIHTAGISPGSGVDNDQKTISSKSLGIPVITVGVPMVIYLGAFGVKKYKNMVVTTKDIDLISKQISRIVGHAINMSVGHMTYDMSKELNANIF